MFLTGGIVPKWRYGSTEPRRHHWSRSRAVSPDPPRESHSESRPASPQRTGRLGQQTRCSPACRSPVNGDPPGERNAAHTPFRSKAWYRTTHQSDHVPTSSRSPPPRLRPSPRAPSGTATGAHTKRAAYDLSTSDSFPRGSSNSHYLRAGPALNRRPPATSLAYPSDRSEDSDCGLEADMTVQVVEGSANAPMSQTREDTTAQNQRRQRNPERPAAAESKGTARRISSLGPRLGPGQLPKSPF